MISIIFYASIVFTFIFKIDNKQGGQYPIHSKWQEILKIISLETVVCFCLSVFSGGFLLGNSSTFLFFWFFLFENSSMFLFSLFVPVFLFFLFFLFGNSSTFLFFHVFYPCFSVFGVFFLIGSSSMLYIHIYYRLSESIPKIFWYLSLSSLFLFKIKDLKIDNKEFP